MITLRDLLDSFDLKFFTIPFSTHKHLRQSYIVALGYVYKTKGDSIKKTLGFKTLSEFQISYKSNMQIEQVIAIIKALYDGINPYTGEQYPPECPYQVADAVRALVVAITSLEKQLKTFTQQRCSPNIARPLM